MWAAAVVLGRDRAVKATTANAADKRRATNTPPPSFVLITAKYNRENIFDQSSEGWHQSSRMGLMMMMGSAS